MIAQQTARRLRSSVNPYAYMLEPETVAELAALGIDFTSINTSGHFADSATDDHEPNDWPMLVLPSGRCLCISKDDEGNGAGAILCDRAKL